MIALLLPLLGFLGPFIPEVIKLFTRGQDNRHELEMFRLRVEAAAQEHLWRMAEIESQADIAEAQAIRAPQQSFGIQLLDKAQASGWSSWFVGPLAFLFTLLDLVNGFVRPAITYAAFAFYVAYKWARFELMREVSDGSLTAAEQITRLWDENDMGVLMTVLAYWFGQRVVKHAFKRD